MLRGVLAQCATAVRVLLVLTVLTGLVYPLGVWAVARLPGLQDKAEGSVIERDGRPVGSALIGIDPVAKDPKRDPWFHTRPSASADGPLGPADPRVSGGSNAGTSNPELLTDVRARRAAIAERESVPAARVPADAVTASASGLDPHISPAYAALQVPRVARATGLPAAQVGQLVAEHTSGRALGMLGEPVVHVLELNLDVRRLAPAGAS
ncbi:K+-transporting ATPase ATPase C chain [Tamaricihabitans halophyticus]|uniref:Potassium-transporting ATPase KdpC subunit n=1 Tax=Tamaricihabitans halophyticus TaxID=1262583 RepID=A0A4R2QQK2_9PSEU|nr:potassium-transporting ATPase subunit KdpC [Tamaricihabitans halophyticus]TCP52010.1 K+-transporting ATPase ATPase C chain [Tamaricihabitans halophyticus]